MDNKQLTESVIQHLFSDMTRHNSNEATQLADWLMANQLTKNKKLVTLIGSWEDSPIALQRRIFWYHQGRLRWVGQKPPANTKKLLSVIEKKMVSEDPVVQWAMNFTAGWIGVFDRELRDRCIKVGEKLGLYKDEIVSKGCTPNYLPLFIKIESQKRQLD